MAGESKLLSEDELAAVFQKTAAKAEGASADCPNE
jgi:hypothetical protein